MFKKIILKGLSGGMVAGLLGASLPALLNSPITGGLVSFIFFIIVAGAVIGIITGGIFSVLFKPFHAYKRLYIFVCSLLCTLAAIGALVPLFIMIDGILLDRINASPPNPYFDTQKLVYLVLLIGCVLCCILYTVFGFLLSWQLFEQFKKIELADPILPEQHVHPTPA